MDSKISVAIISVLVASMVLVAGLPLISGIMGDTVTATNEGAGDLRFNLVDSHVAYTVSIAQNLDDTGIEITNGSDVQTLLYDDASIIYADDNIAIWYDLNDLKLLCPIDGAYVSGNINDDVQVSRTASGVEVSIGDPAEVLTFPAPTWAYVANSTGKYGYFDNGTEITVPTGTPLATVGSYAGVDCYNSHNNYDLPLALDLTQTGNKLSGAKWVMAIAEQVEPDITPLDPGSIIIHPLDPGILDPEPDNIIMSVPTPTYTDGDWGYDIISGGDGDGKAVIVSYSGAGGDVTVPSTVGGYDVYRFGKGDSNANVIPTSTVVNQLTFPNSLQEIGGFALKNCTSITGFLVIPSSVTSIGNQAFYGCSGFTGPLVIPSSVTSINTQTFRGCSGLTGPIVIPSSVTSIGSQAFYGCTGFTGPLVIPSSVTTISMQAFYQCNRLDNLVLLVDNDTSISSDTFNLASSIKTILNLGTLEITTTSYGLNADEISDNVPAMGYLSAVEYTEGSTHTGPTYDLIAILPLVLSAGLVLFCIAVLIRRV